MSADSNPNLCENDFKRVSYKNKLRKSIPKSISNNPNFTYCDTFSNKEACIKRISEAKRELLSSDLFDSVKASLNEGLSALNNPEIFEIICLGLGKFVV
ncbi:hypothetical protein NQ317_014355 [Molorchus minor]|uniref:Uncharacterized protein n=1 Tax=Molorchus minor TaxID=1323400 RepID=A0ABQ9K6R8_9CUCU|nr:hypothetical protein NQ317_014355 [Molorchus minor]